MKLDQLKEKYPKIDVQAIFARHVAIGKQYGFPVKQRIQVALSMTEKEILDKNPEAIINCAGKTGKPNVDWCEDHKVETLYSNVVGPLVLVKVCQELGKYFVHVGTGCVYEGDNNGKGFTEEDKPNFFGSFYSKSKIWSQEALEEA